MRQIMNSCVQNLTLISGYAISNRNNHNQQYDNTLKPITQVLI